MANSNLCHSDPESYIISFGVSNQLQLIWLTQYLMLTKLSQKAVRDLGFQ